MNKHFQAAFGALKKMAAEMDAKYDKCLASHDWIEAERAKSFANGLRMAGQWFEIAIAKQEAE